MRKKIFSALMLVALTLAATSTLVSCKDYDDDIAAVNTRIDNLTASKDALAKDLENVKGDLGAAKIDYVTKINTLRNELVAVDNSLNDKLVGLDAVVKALGIEDGNLWNAIGQTNNNVNDVWNALATTNGNVATNAANISTNTGDINTLKGQMTDVLTTIGTLNTTLGNAISQHNTDIFNVNTRINVNTDSINKNKEYINANAAKIATLVNVTIPALEGRIGALESFKTSAETRLQNLETVIATKADRSELQTAINEANSTHIAIRGEIKDTAATLRNIIGGVQQTLQNQITANKNYLNGLAGWNTTQSDSLKGIYKNVADSVKKINTAIENYKKYVAETYATKAELKADSAAIIKEMKDSLVALDARLTNALNAQVSAIKMFIDGRLTAIYFQPTTFIDGVECIEFASLDYNEWKNFYADAADQEKKTYIDDATTKAVYHFDPATVKKSDVKALDFIYNTASNKKGLRASDGVKLTVASWDVKNGEAVLNLTKNTEAINNSNKDFTIVALKATVDKASEEGTTEVFSDWARLWETSKTPYIHNKNCTFLKDKKSYPNCQPEFAHFFKFSDIYNQYNGKNSQEALHYKLYTSAERDALKENAFQVAYDKTFDLSSIVMVCDHEGNEIDPAAYGLEFQYQTVECYNIKNEGNTDDCTNQCCYTSKAEENPVVYSLAPDKYPHQNNPANFTKKNNSDAIGKTPVYMIRLYDKVNKKVVDVRYVMIEWVLNEIQSETLDAFVKDVRFDCGELMVAKLGEDYLNYFAAHVNAESSKELASRYTFGTKAYGTIADLKAKKNDIADVIVKINGSVDGQADNIQVLDRTPLVLNWTLCETGEQAHNYYVPVYDKSDRLAFIIPVTLNVLFSNQTIIGTAYQKNVDFWKNMTAQGMDQIDEYVVANPTLRTNDKANGQDYSTASGYTDTQLLQNLLNDYIDSKDKKVSPKTVLSLLSHKDSKDDDGPTEAAIVFDQTRIRQMMGSNDWNVNEKGDTLRKKTVIAATIKEGLIQLYEGPDAKKGKLGEPTAPAKEFVAYDNAPEKNSIPVMLVGVQCHHKDTLDKFEVKFERPLKFTAANLTYTVNDQYKEGTTGQFAEIFWNKIVTLVEDFGNRDVIVNAEKYDEKAAIWYIVEGLKIDIANAKFASGTYKDKKLAEVLNEDGKTKKYEIKWLSTQTAYGKDNKGKLGWYNNSGNALTQDLQITIPCTLNTKWRTWTFNLTLTVKQTTTTAK